MAACPYTAEQFEGLIAAAIQTVRYHEGAPTIDALQRAVESCAGPIFVERDDQD